MKKNSINIYGNVINSQIQQGTYGSSQHNRESAFGMSLEACVMLFYAAENDVQIKIPTSLSGTGYFAGKVLLNEGQSGRELARWEAAKKQLLANGYIEQIGKRGVLFRVTDLGYRVSDGFKEANDLDVSMTPTELMKEFMMIDEDSDPYDDDDEWEKIITDYVFIGHQRPSDGKHKRVSEDGIPIAEGEWVKEKLVRGVEYDYLVHVVKGALIFKPDCPEDPYDSTEDFGYEKFEQYGFQSGLGSFWMSTNYIVEDGIENYYVADFKVDAKTEQMINIRTLEEFLTEKDPKQLEHLKEQIEERQANYYDS